MWDSLSNWWQNLSWSHAVAIVLGGCIILIFVAEIICRIIKKKEIEKWRI